jgi:hypothetical protein
MIVKAKDTIVYSLNPEIYNHRTHYISELKEMNIFKDIKRVQFDYKMKDRLRTIITAHIFALIKAIDENDFPLLLLEDDARLFDAYPEQLDVPEECQLVYLGGSLYDSGGIKPNMYIKEYNSTYYRVYNMLCAHAILLPKRQSAKLILDVYTEAIDRCIFNDVSLALRSNNSVFLTPKNSMCFFQEGPVEGITRFKWKDHQNKLKHV